MLSTKVRGKSVSKMRSMRFLAVLLVPVAALMMGAAVPKVLAWGDGGGCVEGDFEAKMIYETNESDGDTGIQIFGDGERWNKLIIIDPDGDLFYSTRAWGSSKNFGWTELFSESYEPNWFDDLSFQDSVNQFEEGPYKFFARTVGGKWQMGCAELSRDIPCAPDEDSLEPSDGDTVSPDDVVLSWDAVKHMLVPNNDGATCDDDGEEIEVEFYQVVVECIETEIEFSIFLEAENEDNQVTLPEEFINPGNTYKWEVLAIAENGNQTIAETFFCTLPEAGPVPECVLPDG